MGVYYDSSYFGVKLLHNGEELYKYMHNEKISNQDMEKVKTRYRELKSQYGNIQIFVNVYCTYTYDFPSTTELVWAFITEKELLN